MTNKYRVKKSECIASIAAKFGFFPETLWQENAELRKLRSNPNVLREGDVLIIPDKRCKEETVSIGAKHVFRRKGVPETLKLRLLDELGEVRANLPYLLDIDGKPHEGSTDSDGYIKEAIPPLAKRGRLLLGQNRDEEIVLDLADLDPIDEIRGVQQRLTNLYYPCGQIDGIHGQKTKSALKQFQKDVGLDATGELDDHTKQALVEHYGV